MFGECLKKSRNLRGVSQAQLAKMINVSQQTVGSWEVNRSSPTPETINQIAEALKVTVDYLLGNTNKPNHPSKIDATTSSEMETFFRLKKGLEPHGLDDEDVDFLIEVHKLHKAKNKR